MSSTWTALISPFNSDSSLDRNGLKTLLKQQAAAQNGVLLLGSTGEALQLTLDEKKEIIHTALEMNLGVPLMIGLSAIDHHENETLIKLCNSLHIYSYLLATPMYSKPGVNGQTEWFKWHLDQMNHRCMLYNVPSRTGVKLNPKVLLNLKGHKNLWALKEASGSVLECQQFIETLPELDVFSGDDNMAHLHIEVGAKGVVSVASNIWPNQTHNYINTLLAKKKISTELWVKACSELFVASNPVPVKFLCHHQGYINTPNPRFPLSAKDLGNNQLIELHNLVQKEY